MNHWRRPPLDAEGQADARTTAHQLHTNCISLDAAIKEAHSRRRKYVTRSKCRGAVIADWVLAELYSLQEDEKGKAVAKEEAEADRRERRISIATRLLVSIDDLSLNEITGILEECSLKTGEIPKVVAWNVRSVLEHIDKFCRDKAAEIFEQEPGERTSGSPR